MPTFITPYSGTAELTASNGLTVIDQGTYTFSQNGYNDSATFGLSLGGPRRAGQGVEPLPTEPITGGLLHLRGENWTIAGIGNTLTSYTDPLTGLTYSAAQCRISVTGRWQVVREPNSNSFNGVGIIYGGITETNLGSRAMGPVFLLSYTSPPATYVIQGSAVEGGAQDTFSSQVFECRCTETVSTENSNREFQSNTITRPVWAYSYVKQWQTA
jgi:hypothetical protein